MRIDRVTLKNFRNADESDITFTDGVNVICGANAAGKTNILEAVFYFATGKSFRNCKDRELIKFGCDAAEITLDFTTDSGVRKNMSVAFSKEARRVIRIGGFKTARLADYLGEFRAVVFTPDNLNLVKGAPENRRRFVDIAICQSFPRYAQSLSEYNKSVAQKNALLKSGRADKLLVDVYNDRIAALSGVISVNRRKYIKNLGAVAEKFITDMTDGAETLRLEYRSQCGDALTQEEVRDRFREILDARFETEKERMVSLYGVHKDDFSVLIDKRSARMYGSQGQQRSAVLALKLAEGELSAQLTGEYPVFLLDDILSELDPDRKDYVLSRLSGRQVIITGCESEIFGVSGKNRITVEGGKAFPAVGDEGE